MKDTHVQHIVNFQAANLQVWFKYIRTSQSACCAAESTPSLSGTKTDGELYPIAFVVPWGNPVEPRKQWVSVFLPQDHKEDIRCYRVQTSFNATKMSHKAADLHPEMRNPKEEHTKMASALPEPWCLRVRSPQKRFWKTTVCN